MPTNGPYSGQIERALEDFLRSTNIWTGLNTFPTIVFPAGGSTPSSTAHALYSPDGTNLYFNGTNVSGGGGGMVYPAAGIGVSTGTAWAGSITNGTGWLHNNGAGVYVYSTPTLADVGFSYPGAGLVLSTGSAWGTSVINGTGWLHNDGAGVYAYSIPTAAQIGATTVGNNLFSLTNPSAITFLRVNADNSVSALGAANYRTALSLVPGTDIQAYNSNLTGINQGLATTALPTFDTLSLTHGMALDGAAYGTHGVQFPSAGATPSSTAHNLYTPDGTTLYFNGVALSSGGTGDVVGPGASTNNGFARWNGTTGKLLKDGAASILATEGGTGMTSYNVGDLVYAPTTTTLGALADVAVGSVLVSGGVNTAPAYSATPSVTSIGLKGATSGTLTHEVAAVAGTNTITWPAGTTNFSATGGTSQVLKQVSAGAAITVAQLAASDLSNGTVGSGTVVLANSASSGKLLQSNGTSYVASTPTFPTAAGTSGKILVSDGTNIVSSTPTFPNASATSGKLIQSDGTNWVASTPTFPSTAGTSGNVLTSNGTNWLSSTPGSASPMTLLKCANGTTNCSGGAQNLDTYAVSGLTVKDTLFYIASLDDGTVVTTTIYNATDSVTLSAFVTTGSALNGVGWITAEGGQTNVSTTRRLYGSTTSYDNNVALTTAWTGAWTIAFRHPGGGGASVKWQWALYKLAGQ